MVATTASVPSAVSIVAAGGPVGLSVVMVLVVRKRLAACISRWPNLLITVYVHSGVR